MLPISNSLTCSLLLTLFLLGTGCASSSSDVTDAWSGTIDTLASGEILVRNTGAPLWSPEETWRVVEAFRIGNDSGEDAILFGSIRSFDVDARGRVYVLDSQVEEIHVFDSEGAFVRTVGTEGTGPGEFERASSVDVNRNGNIWIMEMYEGQLSILDSNGVYLRTERVNSVGWDYWTYPGGIDRLGRYNAAVMSDEEENGELLLARFDQSFIPLDTIPIPRSPVEFDYFEKVLDDGVSRVSAGVPYVGSFDWSFSRSGNFWTLLTKPYELVEISASGKAIRRVNMEFEPLPVTSADVEAAREQLAWFTNQGGQVELSRIPRTKPVISSFFSDDVGNLWVKRVATTPEDEDRLFDLFDPDGRFLGVLQLPFSLHAHPEPIVRSGIIYGVSTDEHGAETMVIARVEKP